MTQNFKRENRYIVFKAKDLECLDTFSQFVLSELCKRVAEVRTQRGKDGLECVVIESDWPEYETVWKMIEARMTGNAAASDVDEDTAKRFRGLLSMLGISAPESDESLMLCQFSFLGMVRHKIQQIYDQPSRTAELEKLLETEGLRLAACSTAALGYFEGCADEFKSASLDDVLRLRASHAELEDKVKRLEAVETLIAEFAEFSEVKISKVNDGYFVSVFPNKHAPMWWYKLGADLVTTLGQALNESERLRVHVLPDDIRALLAEIGGQS